MSSMSEPQAEAPFSFWEYQQGYDISRLSDEKREKKITQGAVDTLRHVNISLTKVLNNGRHDWSHFDQTRFGRKVRRQFRVII